MTTTNTTATRKLTTVTGNLTRDPVMRIANTKNGQQEVLDIHFAVNGKDGSVAYYKTSLWRNHAKATLPHLYKGKEVSVTGFLTEETWTGRDGVQRVSNVLALAGDNSFRLGRDTNEKAQAKFGDSYVARHAFTAVAKSEPAAVAKSAPAAVAKADPEEDLPF